MTKIVDFEVHKILAEALSGREEVRKEIEKRWLELENKASERALSIEERAELEQCRLLRIILSNECHKILTAEMQEKGYELSDKEILNLLVRKGFITPHQERLLEIMLED